MYVVELICDIFVVDFLKLQYNVLKMQNLVFA